MLKLGLDTPLIVWSFPLLSSKTRNTFLMFLWLLLPEVWLHVPSVAWRYKQNLFASLESAYWDLIRKDNCGNLEAPCVKTTCWWKFLIERSGGLFTWISVQLCQSSSAQWLDKKYQNNSLIPLLVRILQLMIVDPAYVCVGQDVEVVFGASLLTHASFLLPMLVTSSHFWGLEIMWRNTDKCLLSALE